MSYSRWSNSCWYTFANVNGCLSVWYDMDKTIDWSRESLEELMTSMPRERILSLMNLYGCAEAEAEEAIGYMEQYLNES